MSYKAQNENVRCTYRTIGGDPSKTIFGEITDATQSLKTNLSIWSNTVTLNNSEVVDIGDSSLIPIYEFVSDPAKKAAFKSSCGKLLELKKDKCGKWLYQMFIWVKQDNGQNFAIGL